MLIHRFATLTGLAVVTLFLAAPANALTMAECSTKYNAAKDAGTLGGQNWNQFRKAECGTDASAATSDTKPAKSTAKASDTTKAATTSDDAAPGLTAKECGTKYQAAKAAGTLNGMKWNDFRKSECAAGASAAAAPAKATTKEAATADDAAPGLTAKECSTKYQAAKAAGTLNGMKWNDFRKSECAGASATAEPAKTTTKAAAATADNAAPGLTAKECSTKYQAAKAAGTLNGMKWNDFRKSECAAGASATEPAKATTKAAATAETGKGLSMAECSTKYQAAKTGNTLNGMKWNDFRKSQCGTAASDDDTVPAPDEATYTSDPETPTVTAPKGVKFPTAISKKFAGETPSKGRMHTCLEQYYANKDANALGGLKWIQKGGGFYSLCNAKLKS